MRVITSGGMVMRSSASVGVVRQGCGLAWTGAGVPLPLPLREERGLVAVAHGRARRRRHGDHAPAQLLESACRLRR